MPRRPPRSETNATSRPSGDIDGHWSSTSPDVRGRGREPSSADTHSVRLPFLEELKTSRSPRGDSVGSRSPEKPPVTGCSTLPSADRDSRAIDCLSSENVATIARPSAASRASE